MAQSPSVRLMYMRTTRRWHPLRVFVAEATLYTNLPVDLIANMAVLQARVLDYDRTLADTEGVVECHPG